MGARREYTDEEVDAAFQAKLGMSLAQYHAARDRAFEDMLRTNPVFQQVVTAVTLQRLIVEWVW